MPTAKRPCPICSSDEVVKIHAQKFILPDGHPLSEGYDVVSCDQCGFVYADTSVTQDEYDRFYAENSKYEDTKTGSGGVSNPFDWNRQQETALQITNFLQNKSASILDVGCANGGILKAVKELGYKKLCGVDPSPICVENTRKLGIDAYQGSLFLPFKENTYDCIILSHTLEHLQDVHGALAWIKKRLKTGGIVYVETPDASRYVDFIYAPFQDFNTEHINHFSLICLQNLMNLCNFKMEKGSTKTLVIAENLFYPAVFGFWKKMDGPSSTNLQRKDNILRSKIDEYIIRSKKMMINIDSQISHLVTQKNSIIVWGTGQLTMKLLAETSLAHANICAFVDNNPIYYGKKLHGSPIIHPQELGTWGNTPILIATLLHHHAIAGQIREMGLNNEIVFLRGDI